MYYQLDDEKEIVPWDGNPDSLWVRVESTYIGDYWVSTVFYGVPRDDNFQNRYFETVIQDETGCYRELVRYRNWDEAVEGHWVLVNNFWWEALFPPYRIAKRAITWLMKKLGWTC